MSLDKTNPVNTEENEAEQENTVSYPFSVAVRFRDAAKPYSFGCYDDSIKKGDWVVVETAQGLEMGAAEAAALSVEKYGLHMPTRPVVRIANETDIRSYEENVHYEQDAYRICAEEIESLGLDMNLLNAQYTLDRSKILFIYLADQRVDFRELLKHLGARLHCRIELRQIGERDKAKMVGGIGMCGMECCCRRFKNHFDVISINMAKNQLLALNTEKLSGMCGKLMCCLKYEDNDYKELTEGLPKMGSQVEYEGGIYRITSMNVMSDEAKLENHAQVVFLSLKDLREKTIPRKGVVMQKRTEGEKKEVIHRSGRVPEAAANAAPHVSMELPTMTEKKNRPQNKQQRPAAAGGGREQKRENPSANNNNNNRRPAQAGANNNNSRRPDQRRRDNTNRQSATPQKSETKNVTVRTFGRKKTQEENK